jgi:hypothetical protein
MLLFKVLHEQELALWQKMKLSYSLYQAFHRNEF